MKSVNYSVFLIAATTLAACTATPPKSGVAPTEAKTIEVVPEAKPLPTLPAIYTQKGVTVKIEGLWQSPEGEILGVSGTAKNVTASDLRFCQVSVAFMDQVGTKVDEAKASTKTLKSAQIWHFQAGLTHPSATSYSNVVPDKVIAIPVKNPKAELASLK